MLVEKAEKIARLVGDKNVLEGLIQRHQKKPFVFTEVTILPSHPVHSQILAVFQNRLRYVESELEGVE